MVRGWSRAAESGFGPASKGKCKESKRTTQCGRWILATNAIKKTSNYLIVSDTSKENKII